jgi:hypothetical protein
MKKKIAVKKQRVIKRKKNTEWKPKPETIEATRTGIDPKLKAKTAKEPEFVGKASSGKPLTKAQDKEYRRQMGWPAR